MLFPFIILTSWTDKLLKPFTDYGRLTTQQLIYNNTQPRPSRIPGTGQVLLPYKEPFFKKSLGGREHFSPVILRDFENWDFAKSRVNIKKAPVVKRFECLQKHYYYILYVQMNENEFSQQLMSKQTKNEVYVLRFLRIWHVKKTGNVGYTKYNSSICQTTVSLGKRVTLTTMWRKKNKQPYVFQTSPAAPKTHVQTHLRQCIIKCVLVVGWRHIQTLM